MRIWPRRTAKRVVFIAKESCIVPSLAAARNGTGAIAFVVQKKIAGDDELRSRCVSWGGESMNRCAGRDTASSVP